MKVLIDQSYLTLGNPMSPGGVALQAPLSKEFSKQVGSYVIPFSRGSSRPGIEPKSPTLQVGSLPSEPPRKPSKAIIPQLKKKKKKERRCRKTSLHSTFCVERTLPQEVVTWKFIINYMETYHKLLIFLE